jgi:hypothetical protein
MRGYLPSQGEDSKQPPRTSLLVRWLPSDHVLLDALRPFKARARGRRFKELATLGAELERRGFRLEAAGDGYRLMLPVDLASGLELRSASMLGHDQPRPSEARAASPALAPVASTAPPPAVPHAVAAIPVGARELSGPQAVDAHQPGPVAPLVDDDTMEFAASFG